jgi:radical SAM superfamily enzyme YgiQ (UPF0313 family)
MPDLRTSSFEIGPIRPPSEGGSSSLLLRITRNCPWGKCKFCYATLYHRDKFSLRAVDDILNDIQTVKRISDEIERVSSQLGYGGQTNDFVGSALIHAEPDLRQNYCFIAVFNWLNAGGRTAFLQDADSLVMPASDLIEVITCLKETFPGLERITSYARARTIYRKTLEELKGLRAAGLNRLHVGLESGDDALLEYVDKGVTAEQHVSAGRKAKEAGFEYSTYVMPGLGGSAMSRQHAANTALVLNQINPDYIRLRPFVPRPGTPLYDQYQNGQLDITSPHARLRELKIMLQALNVTSRVCFDHMLNGWRRKSGELLFTHDYAGYLFPEDKEQVLALIEEGLQVDESFHLDAKDMVEADHL